LNRGMLLFWVQMKLSTVNKLKSKFPFVVKYSDNNIVLYRYLKHRIWNTAYGGLEILYRQKLR